MDCARMADTVSARDLADRAAQFSGVIKINGVDGANGASANVGGRDANEQTSQRENGKFGASVSAVEVFAGIGKSERDVFMSVLERLHDNLSRLEDKSSHPELHVEYGS